jgi:transcriptional regulator with XRE-family HTH domain
MTPREAFGRALRRLREARGMSQEELAFRAGYSRQQVSLIERAAVNPTLDAIFLLSEALAVAPSELLQETERQVTALPVREPDKLPGRAPKSG